MTTQDDEEQLLQSVALKNAKSILLARQRAEQELVEAKEALERRTKELAQSLSLVRATLESTADGILATDRAGKVTEFNERFVEMWQLPPAVLRTREHAGVLEVISRHLREPARFAAMVNEILTTSPREKFDVLELTDGRVVEQYTRVQELGHRAVGRVWSYRDVTKQARTEAALREAKEAAEAANRAKSEFLAVMSHELRTPLNAIGGYVELMEMGIRGPVSEQQREDLRRIQRSQRHLLGLINEVLNYARIETGTVQYELTEIRVRDALTSAEGLIAPQVWEKGVTMTVLESSSEVVVRADAEKLRQILLNLLSNAVKFTTSGGRIELGCTVQGDRVCLSVRDTGIGIPEDKLGAIFEPFVQVRSDLARPSEGTGLGLAISRDLARGMGGDLTVESELGKGSRFTLLLPRA
ncbi:MAG TPA: ATP-binding protein [Longimicrobiaceae bacterium]|nr:ATP-binding protein [Longimicrobiaceae bacterium]